MKTTADYLDALHVKLNLPNDSQLAAHLGMHKQQIYSYRRMQGTFSEEWSLRIADILEIDPAEIFAAMHYQRERNESARKVWERIYKSITTVTAALAVIALLPGILGTTGSDHHPQSLAFAGFTLSSLTNTVYYVKWPEFSAIDAYWQIFLILFLAFIHFRPRYIRTKQ